MSAVNRRIRTALAAILAASFALASMAQPQQPADAGSPVRAGEPRPPTSTAGTNATAPRTADTAQPHAGASATANAPRLLTPAEQEAAKQAEATQRDEKRALEERMDVLAQRWRKRAAAEGWKVHPPGAVEQSGGR